MACKKGLEFLKIMNDYIQKPKGFHAAIQKISIIDGGRGKCLAEFKIQPEHLNLLGGLHGGATATIVDDVTTYALLTHDNNNEAEPGATVDLHVSYLKSAREGDDVIIEAKTKKFGKTLAYIECELRHKKDGSIIAIGSQTKSYRKFC